MKQTAASLALIVALASCAANTPGANRYGDDTKPTRTPSGSARGRSHAKATSQPHAIPGYKGKPRYGSDPGSLGTTYNDGGNVGSAAATYLRATPARKMVLEVDYVTDRAPSDPALSHLKTILERETDKPGGVDIVVDDRISDVRDQWSYSDITSLEHRYRDRHSSDDTVTMWMLFLSGTLEDGSDTLGVSYEATAAAIFPDRMRASTTALVNETAIEKSVLTHEAGHLLGLVNLAVKSRYDHEDAEHPGHSKFEDSVMYWAIEDTSIAALLSGGPPADFDRFDRADLAAIRDA